MIKNKLYKYRKLIICVMVILGIAIAFVTNSHMESQNIAAQHIHTYPTGVSYIAESHVIDKEMVIRSLSKTQQLVGMEGVVNKTYIYSDNIFNDNKWIDWLGQRTLEIDANAFFKMGINLGDISSEDIRVYGNTLHIKLPKQVLVSLDIPYDQLIFKSQTGILRSELGDVEKQQLYSDIRRIVTDNIMNDSKIHSKSEDGVKEALSNLLSKIPNVDRIVFQSKMADSF